MFAMLSGSSDPCGPSESYSTAVLEQNKSVSKRSVLQVAMNCV